MLELPAATAGCSSEFGRLLSPASLGCYSSRLASFDLRQKNSPRSWPEQHSPPPAIYAFPWLAGAR